MAKLQSLLGIERFDGWLQRGSIQQQVSKIFNLFALLVLCLGAVATIGAVRIEQRSTTLADLTETAFLTAGMGQNINEAKNNMGAYRARGYDPEAINSAVQHVRNAIAMGEQLAVAARGVDEANVAQVQQVDGDLNGLITVLDEVGEAPRDLVVQESFLGPRYDAFDAVIAQTDVIREEAAAKTQSYSGDGLLEIQALIGILCIGVLIALGLVFMGKRLVARRIVNPIAEISDISERIAEGETNRDIPESERDDEIGKLATALNVLRKVQDDASAQAERDHQRELEGERALQEEREQQLRTRSDLLKSLADKFEETVSGVANEVAAASDQMHAAASDLASNVEASSSTVSGANTSLKQAADGISSAAAATDEFALSINEVSAQASSSSERARKAAEASAKADLTIGGLTSSADRISQIVEVIAGIAQRTNLLALNASIEAARGGESGRGFAVVASEVKELALQTGRATEEVEGLIRAMQSATGDSAAALTMISEEVVELESTALTIATAVDQQAVASQDLARSIDLAARNTQNVSETIDDVSAVSVASGATAAQMRTSSAMLNDQAGKLREHVGEFLSQVRAA